MKGIEYDDLNGNDAVISGIAYDSRSVREGDVYFALSGENFDGAQFIPEAIERGCSAVVSREYDRTPEVAAVTTSDPPACPCLCFHQLLWNSIPKIEINRIYGHKRQDIRAPFPSVYPPARGI